jgi:hypothetical protein
MPYKMHYRPDSPYSTAELLIARHGTNAISGAVKEMGDCQASGDGDCYLAWGTIYDAIVELQERTPKIASKPYLMTAGYEDLRHGASVSRTGRAGVRGKP